jgi:hypothetical protein
LKPFGAIDSPDQGDTISGALYTNFGWALTPMPNSIPVNGSTIVVYIDGVPVGNPVYNQQRSDIATLFPGRANSDGAVGFYQFDTTQLANGVHTISWAVTDNNGNSEGIGSRFFTVLNTSGSSSLTVARNSSVQSLTGGGPEVRESAPAGVDIDKPSATLAGLTPSAVPVYTRTGFDQSAPLDIVETDVQGIARVQARQAGRIGLTLGPAMTDEGDGYEGYLVANGTLTALPAGAFLDRRSGDFSWQPGVGFVGAYDLAFVWSDHGVRRVIRVQVTIRD